MAFCTKCGRQLQDGEVCNCQAATPVTPVTPVAPAAPAAPAQPGAAAKIFGEIWNTIIGLVKTPADTAVSSTQKASFPVAGIIIGLVALVKALFDMFSTMVAYSGSSSSIGSWEDLLGAMNAASNKPNYFLVLLNTLLVVIAVAAASAAMYMLLVQVLGGGKMSYIQALHVAAIAVVMTGIVAPVAFVIDVIPAGFFSALANWVVVFASTLGTVYAITAINAFVVKKNMLPYIIACVAVVNAFVSYIINLMF